MENNQSIAETSINAKNGNFIYVVEDITKDNCPKQNGKCTGATIDDKGKVTFPVDGTLSSCAWKAYNSDQF